MDNPTDTTTQNPMGAPMGTMPSAPAQPDPTMPAPVSTPPAPVVDVPEPSAPVTPVNPTPEPVMPTTPPVTDMGGGTTGDTSGGTVPPAPAI